VSRPFFGKSMFPTGLAWSRIGDGFQVPAGAEGAALAPEHGDVGGRIAVELEEGRHQLVGAPGVHGIAGLGRL
jgi:hypothetical protein